MLELRRTRSGRRGPWVDARADCAVRRAVNLSHTPPPPCRPASRSTTGHRRRRNRRTPARTGQRTAHRTTSGSSDAARPEPPEVGARAAQRPRPDSARAGRRSRPHTECRGPTPRRRQELTAPPPPQKPRVRPAVEPIQHRRPPPRPNPSPKRKVKENGLNPPPPQIQQPDPCQNHCTHPAQVTNAAIRARVSNASSAPNRCDALHRFASCPHRSTISCINSRRLTRPSPRGTSRRCPLSGP